jgi:hypothetical protein
MNDVTRTSKENYILGEKQRNVLMSAADALEHGNNLAILAMMVRDIANGKQPAHEPLSAPDDMDESGRNGHFQNYGYVGTASGFIVRDGTFWVATFRTGAEADQYVDLRNEEQPASALPTFVCPVCKADPCQTVWHDQACDYAPTDDGIAHVGGKGCIPKITRPSPPPGTALQALAKFGAAVIEEARGELGDLDGGWLQDKAVECGVLEPVTALAPCGDECRCAEYDDFPQECFQYPDDVRSALTKGGE